MNLSTRRILLTSLKLFDLLLTTLSYGLATFLVVHANHDMSFEQFLSIRIKLSNCVIFLGTLLAWHLIFVACGLYESKRLATLNEQLREEWRATTLSTMWLLLVAACLSIRMVTPVFLAMFWVISSAGLLGSRLLIRRLLMRLRLKGRNLRYVLILGTNARAIEFARRIEAHPDWGYRILGFADVPWAGTEAFENGGFRLISDLAFLNAFLRDNVVDEVAIYLPWPSFYKYAAEVAALCKQHGIVVRFDPDVFGLRIATQTETFEGYHSVATYARAHGTWSLIAKRAIDVVVSFLLLALLAPLLGVVALLIKLTSEGPIFFEQDRIGFNKRRFLIYKFRTMVPGAEEMMSQIEELNEVSGPVFKIKNDPRITPLGKFLRRTSIDELPQLWNVLKGDMSLVGPRPLPIRDYKGFSEDWQRRRFCTRPGITCLWQVNGRSSIPFEQWMKLDIQYLDEWSLWLDFKILARTIPAVLKGFGAV